ncbi:MAG: M20 family metallopeptidase [Dehalococcoidia bacterium]|nr:MAG: M20 family metallopeptidase [Dehalococcoidia bacterium]
MDSDLLMLKSTIMTDIDSSHQQLAKISLKIHSNPENGFKEYKASNWLVQYLENSCFKVELGFCQLETAFKAVYGNKRPAIAIIAEYDALPQLGHACGHNLIAAIAVGAAVASRATIDKLGGSILVIGTPAEEIHGGKVIMVQRGAFNNIDMAIMVHPSTNDTATTKTLACASLDIELFGHAAHAAAHPEEGINSLEAMILSFNAVNSLRQHLRDDARIHGIITNGGQVVNVVPAYSAASFLVRAKDETYLEELKGKVLNCFKGAAHATGAELKYKWGNVQYAPMRNNMKMANLFITNMNSLGRSVKLINPDQSFGSTDMGNVSQVVPSIHPSIAIAPRGVSIHSHQFVKAAASDAGIQGMIDAAKAVAMMIVDLLSSPETTSQVKKEFASKS